MNSFYTKEELNKLGLKSYGQNVKISRKASIYIPENISVGNNVQIDDFCMLIGGEKGIFIGNNVHIAFACLILGTAGVVFEDFSSLSSRSAIYSATDDYSGRVLINPTIPMEYKNIIKGRVIVGKHAVIGTNCTVLPDVKIGTGCAIGANSLIIKDLEDWGIYVGSPVKKIKNRKRDLIELEKRYTEKYNYGKKSRRGGCKNYIPIICPSFVWKVAS